jgi:hypothetical protein
MTKNKIYCTVALLTLSVGMIAPSALVFAATPSGSQYNSSADIQPEFATPDEALQAAQSANIASINSGNAMNNGTNMNHDMNMNSNMNMNMDNNTHNNMESGMMGSGRGMGSSGMGGGRDGHGGGSDSGGTSSGGSGSGGSGGKR